MKRNYLLMALCCLSFLFSAAQQGFPVPARDALQLFYLQRTSNHNTIVYELSFKNGKLDVRNPVHPFWIRYTEQSQRAELNFIQRTFAYGVKAKMQADSSYVIKLVSYSHFSMTLKKGADGKYRIYAPINQQLMVLDRIFVKITGGSMWSPDIEYFELSGWDPATGKPVSERKKVLKDVAKS
jgi:hypothetical protein